MKSPIGARCLRERESKVVMTMAMANSLSSGFNSMKVWKAIGHPKCYEPKFISSLGFGNSRAFRTKCDYSCFEVREVSYRPPGTELSLLNAVTFSLPEKSFGLIFGQSGSGKTTLLQLLAGLSRPTSGSITIQRYGNDGNPNQSPEPLPSERVGIVFQFPERYFVADNVLDEVTFGWPRQKSDIKMKEHLALRLQRAINWVGLNGILLDKDPHSLSGGYKRRLALAIQLVQIPDLLILDEPLAGLGMKMIMVPI
uniref:ABC transporter I family member 11, chloroplastic-like isoform X2 n=1 Tax=Ziziphus jujuba TaxID=326968 RepID=A0A6P3Z1J5_ZIZJJ